MLISVLTSTPARVLSDLERFKTLIYNLFAITRQQRVNSVDFHKAAAEELDLEGVKDIFISKN